MKKKLITQGPLSRQSYTLTLPKDWILEQGLEKNKEVELEMVGNLLIIRAQREEETLVVQSTEFVNSLKKAVQNMYRSGVMQIKIFYDDAQKAHQIVELTQQYLPGFEAIELTHEYAVLKDIAHVDAHEFHQVMRRIWLLLLQIVESKQTAAVNKAQIKRLINYAQRALLTQGHAEYRRLPLYYIVLDRLEKIADELSWIHEQKKIVDLKRHHVLLRDTYALYYSFSPQLFDEAAYSAYRLREELEDATTKTQMHLHNLARITNSLLGDIYTMHLR